MVDVGDAYLEVQGRLIEAVEEPNADVLTAVAACPGWSSYSPITLVSSRAWPPRI